MLDLRSLNPIVLSEAHRGDLVDHLLLLPEEQRYTRFIGVMTDGAIQAFAARIDFARELLVGLPDPAGGFLGVVQASRQSPHEWELAFSTAPAFQRRGIATRLGRWVLARLIATGAQRAFIYCAPKNIAMRGLAAKLGFSVHVAGGEVIANRHLSPEA